MADLFIPCVFVLAVVALVSWTRRSDKQDKRGGPFWLVGYRKSDNQPVVFGTSDGRHDAEETLHDHLWEGDRSQYHTIELQGRTIAPCRYYTHDYANKKRNASSWIVALVVVVLFGVWLLSH